MGHKDSFGSSILTPSTRVWIVNPAAFWDVDSMKSTQTHHVHTATQSTRYLTNILVLGTSIMNNSTEKYFPYSLQIALTWLAPVILTRHVSSAIKAMWSSISHIPSTYIGLQRLNISWFRHFTSIHWTVRREHSYDRLHMWLLSTSTKNCGYVVLP